MVWILEAGTLLIVAFVLRRALHMTPQRLRFCFSKGYAGPESNDLYSQVATEFGTHTAILAVTLNDAFEEYKGGRSEIAWPLVRLCDEEWSRFAERVRAVQDISSKYLPTVEIPIPVRNINTSEFLSRTMIEYVRLYEVLDQFIFRSKTRFQLHLRLLRRATAMLSDEFHRTSVEAGKNAEQLSQILSQLNLYFHDLDMVAKETLLGLRSLLGSLSNSALTDISVEIEALLIPPVRKSFASVIS